jgi:hypothetical protein
MSFDKAIEHGKEKRKQYTNSKLFDSDCRNHGYCEYCRDNRLYQSHRELLRLKLELDSYFNEHSCPVTKNFIIRDVRCPFINQCALKSTVGGQE